MDINFVDVFVVVVDENIIVEVVNFFVAFVVDDVVLSMLLLMFLFL